MVNSGCLGFQTAPVQTRNWTKTKSNELQTSPNIMATQSSPWWSYPKKKLLKRESLSPRISTGQSWLGLELKNEKTHDSIRCKTWSAIQRFRWSLECSKEGIKRPQHLANSNTPKAKNWKVKTSREKGGKRGINPWTKLAQRQAFISIQKSDYTKVLQPTTLHSSL